MHNRSEKPIPDDNIGNKIADGSAFTNDREQNFDDDRENPEDAIGNVRVDNDGNLSSDNTETARDSDRIDEDQTQTPPYSGLDPNTIIHAIEAYGYLCDGRLLALNSYENRVYQVGIEEQQPIVAKFYRPERWSDAMILEEHAFALELEAAEIPMVAPLVFDGQTLLEHKGFRFALFPRRGGRTPELDNDDSMEWIGRFLGRIHAIGASTPFEHRLELTIERFGIEPRNYLLDNDWLPSHLEDVFAGLTQDLLTQIENAYQRCGQYQRIRLHGDCHPSNILWTEAGPHFVDLDDCQTGPAIQDLWMLLSGDRAEMSGQLSVILEGYEQFHEFDPRELHLMQALRTLRMIHYTAWLARRWHDPAFPRAFPWFNTMNYWEQQVLDLREQAALVDEGPLAI